MLRDDGEEGVRLGVVVPAKHWWLPQPEKLGGQLPAGCGEPLPCNHVDGDNYQELVARYELQLMSKVMLMRKTPSAAWQWTCFLL